MIVLKPDDLATFSDATRREILERLQTVIGTLPDRAPKIAPNFTSLYDGIDVERLEDITRKHVHRWMEGLSAPVYEGVRLIAEFGPVIRASRLLDAGISVRHFQSATTRRTRAFTGDAKAYFLAWDRWHGVDDPNGRYAVSPITHQSLQSFFRL